MAEELDLSQVADDELIIDELTRPNTEASFLFVAIVGVLLTVAVLAIAYFCNNTPLQRFYDIMLRRGPILYFTMLFGMLVVGHVVQKARIIKVQRAFLNADPIEPGTDLGVDENVTMIRREMREIDGFEDSILLRHLDRSMSQWLGSRDVSLVATWSSSESDRNFDASGSSQVLAGVLLAMVPMLGFIGTVLGLSGAVAGFSAFLGGSVEMSEITGALKKVTGDLGVAFDTTLLSLSLSVILTFPLAIMIRRENDMLSEFDSCVDDNLISKLPPHEAATIRIENLEDSIDAAFRRYIPDPDRYDEVFSRAIDKSGEVVADRFSGLVTSYEGIVSDMTTRLAASMASAGDSVEASMRSVVTDVQQQDEAMVSSRKTIAREETDRLHGLLEAFHQQSSQVAAAYQLQAQALESTTREGMERATGAAADLAGKLADVRETAGKIDQLLRLEESVEKSLAGLAASEEFRKTLDDLRGHLNTTDDLCKRLSKPRVIKFRDQPAA